MPERVVRARGYRSVTGSYSRTVFNGIRGWRVSYEWKQGTAVHWYLFRGNAGYVLTILLARSVTPQERRVFYDTSRSFRISP
jgi:hypothetical protein